VVICLYCYSMSMGWFTYSVFRIEPLVGRTNSCFSYLSFTSHVLFIYELIENDVSSRLYDW
jgi:hypothetical protein